MWPLCSFSPKTTKTEKCSNACTVHANTMINEMFTYFSWIKKHHVFKACNGSALFASILSSSWREISPLCHTGCFGLDVALYLCRVVSKQRIWEIDFDLTGDFLLVSERFRQQKKDGLISQVCVERVDSNSGAETRQGQKKEVGGETKTATQPDAAVELEPKYSTEWQGRGRGCLWCIGWRELAVWVIVYHISIDHSHPNWKHWAAFRFLIDFFFFFVWSESCSDTCWNVLECNFGTMNPFWTLNSCIRGPPGRSAEDGVDKLFNPFTRRYFSDSTGLCRGWVRVPPMRNIGF